MSLSCSVIPARTQTVRRSAALWILALALPAAGRAAPFDAPAFFAGQCSGCHSVGRGQVVGPDLAGVTARHARPWLRAFIRSSQSVVRGGDAEAVALYGRYRKVMPDHDLAEPDLDTLLDWIAAGGRAREATVRAASEASGAEVARGRDLFLGRARFAAGGAACAHCHTAGQAGEASLGGDLAQAYGAYGDWGLGRAIAAPGSPLMAQVYAGRPLADAESFAVRAYLHRAWRDPMPPRATFPASSVPLLGFGSSALVLWLARREPRGRA